ncbi:MAG: hypothetical protein IT379_32155 [Deltaproteobacteria bacterium]|nr:hypothetical protein [Deltaproteobacteria bacterium]
MTTDDVCTLVSALALSVALWSCGRHTAREDAAMVEDAGEADTGSGMGVPCTFDCECAGLPTIYGAGYICDGHCRESGLPARGICRSDCACSGGTCDGRCCRLSDGRIATPDDPECQR